MTKIYQIGDAVLSMANGIYLMEHGPWQDHMSSSSASAWRGGKIYITDLRADVVKVQFSGIATSRAALESMATYDINNYDWNTDPEDVYLIEEEARKWKVYGLTLRFKPRLPKSADRWDFTLNMLLSTIATKSISPLTKSGTATTSPTDITDLANSGTKEAQFESINLVGIYASGNLTNPKIAELQTGLSLEVADVLLDRAEITFLDNYLVRHVAPDDLVTATRWGYNKDASSGVTYDADHLDFANNSYLRMRYRLKHPLKQDPVLTLSVSSLVGVPVLEVSIDNSNWYAMASLVSGNNVKYTLQKLSGASDFYWRISCGAAASMALSHFSLESWHSYSGQGPALYVSAGTSDETIRLTFSAGNVQYSISWLENNMI